MLGYRFTSCTRAPRLRLSPAVPVGTLTSPLFNAKGATVYHHVSIGVESLDRAAAFYDASLAPLGYVRLWRNAISAGYGPKGFKGEAPFAIVHSGPEAKRPGRGFHIAFAAPSHEAIDRFHASALSSGGVDEGKPGIRENYAPDYYAAFVSDPDGHRVEAVVYPPPAD